MTHTFKQPSPRTRGLFFFACLVAGALAACSAKFVSGETKCSPDGACPAGFTCNSARVCVDQGGATSGQGGASGINPARDDAGSASSDAPLFPGLHGTNGLTPLGTGGVSGAMDAATGSGGAASPTGSGGNMGSPPDGGLSGAGGIPSGAGGMSSGSGGNVGAPPDGGVAGAGGMAPGAGGNMGTPPGAGGMTGAGGSAVTPASLVGDWGVVDKTTSPGTTFGEFFEFEADGRFLYAVYATTDSTGVTRFEVNMQGTYSAVTANTFDVMVQKTSCPDVKKQTYRFDYALSGPKTFLIKWSDGTVRYDKDNVPPPPSSDKTMPGCYDDSGVFTPAPIRTL